MLNLLSFITLSRHELELIREFVTDLSDRLNPNHFEFSQNPAGLDSLLIT